MPRSPKPWFRKDRRTWCVTIEGVRHSLGEDREQAFQRFHQLMANPPQRQVWGDSLLGLFELFLEWTERNRSQATYHWYRQFLQSFVQTIPARLTIHDLKPFHVQRWVDAAPELSNDAKRAKIRSVQRALSWARQQGYTTANPLATLQKPPAGQREVVISPAQYQQILDLTPDDAFRELATLAWETGARPQELLKLEARHFEPAHARWVFPRQEAKGKRKPRIVYLTAPAEELTRRLADRRPEGPLLRNSDDQPWRKDAVNCRFKRLAPKPGFKFCLYHFRHSFATRQLQLGVDPLTVAELLGHSDPSMLARVYQHLSHDPQHMLQQLRRSAP